jgi:excisionase family DNA binding protein
MPSKEARPKPLLLRPAEASEMLGVSRAKCYELIASGQIPSVKLGGCVRVPLEEFKTWVRDQVKERAEAR